jgi:hypothetical protein
MEPGGVVAGVVTTVEGTAVQVLVELADFSGMVVQELPTLGEVGPESAIGSLWQRDAVALLRLIQVMVVMRMALQGVMGILDSLAELQEVLEEPGALRVPEVLEGRTSVARLHPMELMAILEP